MYVNGALIAVPTANKQAYAEMASRMAKAFRANGALSVMECWGVDVPDGDVTSMPMAVQCAPDETVVFSWITWPSKAVADAGMGAVMSDPALGSMMRDAPFDGKRMIFGGFETIVEA
ncbi:DUF1428 domain-containing protein [Rhodobacteraceae bacterium NNCM2]|nr:DUF1428 domain-containing protein [Coraliihabitans acroporae]